MDTLTTKQHKYRGTLKIYVLHPIPGMIKLVSCFAEKLAGSLAGLGCCENAVDHTDEDVGGGVAELASGEQLDRDAFFSWSCRGGTKSK